jgi:hypothetical protein
MLPPFANRGLSRCLAWSASGDEWGIKKRGLKVQMASKAEEERIVQSCARIQ